MNTSVIDLSKVSETRRDVATVGDPGSLIQAIATAARDPSTDMDKMERLFAMHEKMVAREAEKAFNAAMSLAQAEMGRISTNAENDHTHSRYATYGQIDKKLRPIYTRHGFALSFDEIDSPKPEHVRLLCYVSHRDGHTRTYRIDMPTDGKGAKGNDVMTKTHASGSAHSYGRRYLLKDVFNVAIGEDDNDGNGPPLSPEQIKSLEALLEKAGANKINFMNWARVKTLGEILACNYDSCVEAIERKAGQINPRGNVSDVDFALRDKHVSAITDILNSDKEERDISVMLNEYVATYLQSYNELYICVSDELAKSGVISKANWRKYLKIAERLETP